MTTIFQRERRMPSLAGASEWVNSEPLSPAGLQGRVVLIDFGTYTCINWLRTLPHIRAWAERYREHGLVVVGIRTPEFELVRQPGHVEERAFEITFHATGAEAYVFTFG